MFDPARALSELRREFAVYATWTYVSSEHVAAELSSLPARSRVLSIGGGTRLMADRLLALRFPHVLFTATDLELDTLPALPPNLQARRMDILQERGRGEYDFVYSVECLEHIEDDSTAADNLCSYIRPGGTALVVVPYASAAAQVDPETIKRESVHGHVRPGYDRARLKALFGRYFTELRCASCYWWATHLLRQCKQALRPDAALAVWEHIEALARTDVRAELADNKQTAQGIKVLCIGRH